MTVCFQNIVFNHRNWHWLVLDENSSVRGRAVKARDSRLLGALSAFWGFLLGFFPRGFESVPIPRDCTHPKSHRTQHFLHLFLLLPPNAAFFAFIFIVTIERSIFCSRHNLAKILFANYKASLGEPSPQNASFFAHDSAWMQARTLIA